MRADYSDVRGFNYQMSSGTTSLENWLGYDPALVERELRRGVEHFPAFNAVRLWLSYDAYARGPAAFRDAFESMLQIADRLGLSVVACLLNRWHDAAGYDNGGVYLDHFLTPRSWAYYVPKHEAYLADVVGAHRGDPRVLIWDLCNEPMPYTEFDEGVMALVEPELRWLAAMHAAVKAADPVTPVGVSAHNALGVEGLRWFEPLSDVLLFHPYLVYDSREQLHDEGRRARFDAHVARYVDLARSVGKPLLATETVWGRVDDGDRAESIRVTLGTLTRHGVGFLAHALHHSRVCDLHVPEPPFGELYMPFLEADGSLRPGHEAFNEF